MRHQKYGRKLGRNHHQRQALFKSLLKAICQHGQIETTQAKAKSVQPLVEKIVHHAQRGNLADRHLLYRYFQNRHLVNDTIAIIQATFPKQTSNFTKMVKISRRQGDDSLITRFSFVKPLVKPELKAVETVKKNKKETTKIVKKPVKTKK